MDKVKYVGTIGVFLGMLISGIVGSYFGVDGKIVVMFTLILVTLFMLLYMAIKKYVAASIFMFIGMLPIYISFIGMFLGNDVLGMCGLLSLFIIGPILIKIMPYFKKK